MANPFGDIGGSVVEKIFTSVLWLGISLVVIFVVGIVIWYFAYYRRKFDIKLFIKSSRTGNKFKIIEDSAAILNDRKTKTKFLRLFETKKDLPTPPFQVLQSTNKGDLIELWRKSEDEFVYLTPGTINKKIIIRQDGTEFPLAKIEQKQIEGDISYWNVKTKEKHKALFDTENILMKILPYVPQIVGGMFMIFMLYILMDHLPSILSQLTELTKQLQELN